MIAVAEEAGVAPGLLHHYFKNKREMLFELLNTLVMDFRSNLHERSSEYGIDLNTYIDTALKLDERSDTAAAKCWVGILAEGLKDKRTAGKNKASP